MNRAQILQAAQRLSCYAERAQKHLQTCDRREHQEALADLAEADEIARRLYNAVVQYLRDPMTPDPPAPEERLKERMNTILQGLVEERQNSASLKRVSGKPKLVTLELP